VVVSGFYDPRGIPGGLIAACELKEQAKDQEIDGFSHEHFPVLK
jgi:hypothetical protein